MALYNINNFGASFITRAKASMDYSIVESNFNIDPCSGLRAEKTIVLNGRKSKKLYLEQLRLVAYYDDEKDVELVLLTNNFEVPALEVARLYRNRWPIETFFNWINRT